MPGRVVLRNRRFVRLSDAMLERIEHLARLAGVSVADVVEFILIEAFDGDTLPDHAPCEPAAPDPVAPAKGRRTRRPSKRPADVIPITRNRPHPRRPGGLLDHLDLPYLRRSAAEVCRLAQAARAHAAGACHRADRARALAQALLASR